MARGINKVILIGNCGQDPETKFAASGAAITNLSVATSESWKDKQTGQMQDRTEWHRVVFFNRLAEIAGEYLKKGSKVYIEGKLQTRKWQDQNGQDRYTTEIVANEMQMLDSRGGAGEFGGAGGGYGAQQGGAMGTPQQNPMGGGQAPQAAPQQNYNQGGGYNQGGYGGQQQAPAQQAPQRAPQQQAPSAPEMDSFDDDIPF